MPEIGFMKRMFINKAINIKTFALGGLAASITHYIFSYIMAGPEITRSTSLPVALFSGIGLILAQLLNNKFLRYVISYRSPEGKYYYIKFMDKDRTTLMDDADTASIFNSKKAASKAVRKVELVPKENILLVTMVWFDDDNDNVSPKSER